MHSRTTTRTGTSTDLRHALATVTNTKPSDADVARVRSRLAAGGWPLANPQHFDPANWP